MSYLLLFAAVLIVLFHGYLLGARLIRNTHWAIAIIPGIATFLAFQSLLQTAWYYFGGSLGTPSDIGTLAGAVALSHLFVWTRPKNLEATETITTPTSRRRVILGIGIALIGLVSSTWIIRAAYRVATTDSIRTPWPLLPPTTLWMVALGWLALFASVWFVRSRILATLHGMFLLASTLSLTALIYRIGYGFDGFLHIASEKILLSTGTLSPKPLYYIGQYVFTTWLARWSHIPVSDIDRWLLPVTASILLPVALFCATARHKSASFLMLAVVPLGAFIATTPQGVAYLFGLLALIFAIGSTKNDISPVVPLIFACWSVATHPLAGIPLLLVTLAVLFAKIRFLPWISVALATFCVPAMFYVISLKGGTPIAWNLGSLFSLAPWHDRLASFFPYLGNHYVLWPAWATLADIMLPVILITLASVSIWHGRREGDRTPLLLLLSAIGLWVAGTALRTTGDFAFLIDYERGNYANRLDTLAILCLLPASLIAFDILVAKLRTSPKSLTLAFGLAGIGIATALTYNALPRNDALVNGHGWSTSKSDLDAVQLIDRDAGDRPYTVLANQSVSAAAVASLGFKRYAGDIFFYPIPTGGPLYETYLRMTYNEPSRDTIKDAAALGKTGLVYVVLNDYWWKASTVSEDLKTIAQKNWEIANGKVWVYKFDASTPSSASTTTSN